MRKMRVLGLLAAFAVLIGCSSWTPADIVNGNFEDGLTGWSIAGTGWNWYEGSPTPDGTAAIYNGSTDAWLYQPGCTATFVEGQEYELTFLASGSGASVGTDLHVDLITGSGTHTEYVTLTGGFVECSLVFTATSADVGQTFQPGFLGKGGYAVAIDSVSLSAVPEPATMGLLLSGTAIGLIRRKR